MNSPFDPYSLPLQPLSQSDKSICLATARIVLADRILNGCLQIENGTISSITEDDNCPDGAIDCGQDLVIPGLVELHTDNLERHLEPRPTVNWPHAPAILAHDRELAGCGITTVFDALRVGAIPGAKGRSLQYARALADALLELRQDRALKISHFLHLRAEVCSETLPEELAGFSQGDRVGIVSLMDHTPGQRQFRDVSSFKDQIVAKYDMSEAEFSQHLSRLTGLGASVGARHEAIAVKEARRLGAVLASHDDTTEAHVAASADYGVAIAEFPTTVAAAKACRDKNIAIMMGAPNLIRGGSHTNNVSATDLAEQGLLDINSSDYVPASLLQAAFRLGQIWDDLPRAIRTVSTAPAKAAALNDRGRLEVGLRADVVRVRDLAGVPLIQSVWSAGARVA